MTPTGYPQNAPTDPLSALGVQLDESLDENRESLPPSRRRKARPRTEALVRADCIAEIQARGGYVIIAHQDGNGVRGTPDLIWCIEGRMGVTECKREDAEPPTPAQMGQLRQWQKAGALAGWVRNANHLRELLDHLHDVAWVNDFDTPGDGRGKNAPW